MLMIEETVKANIQRMMNSFIENLNLKINKLRIRSKK